MRIFIRFSILLTGLTLLTATSACAGAGSAPSMVDYSYVPHTSKISAPGIESF